MDEWLKREAFVFITPGLKARAIFLLFGVGIDEIRSFGFSH